MDNFIIKSSLNILWKYILLEIKLKNVIKKQVNLIKQRALIEVIIDLFVL